MPFDYAKLKTTGRPNRSHLRPTNLDKFYFGACYYPEHWSESDRKNDIKLMLEAGINIVRLAEFAWDIIEPEEGVFDFTFFDQVIKEIADNGIDCFLCTPTAAPPRWLSKNFPQVQRVDADGRTQQHGSRQHACHSSDILREFSRRVTRAMAEHYKDNPSVKGWQTDNEFTCHFSQCYCESCEKSFAEYLRWCYGDDMNKLNSDWGTAFWAQTYHAFEDIPLPREKRPTYENPAHRLEYKKYLSDAVTRFQNEQIIILRETNPDWFVFHNGLFSALDNRGDFSADLDFMGVDTYPHFAFHKGARAQWHAAQLDETRSIGGNFIVPEHQSGPGGQGDYFHDNPEPGEIRRMTYASIARGADSLMYFRWRTCRFGAEQYWCGIIDHDNIPRRRFREIAGIGKEIKRYGNRLLNTVVHIDAAVCGSDFVVDEAHHAYSLGLPSSRDVSRKLHGWLYDKGFATGYVQPHDKLAGLKLYVIPHWAYFDEKLVPLLEKYVEDGGTLVVGARTATRDTRNQIVADMLPGCLSRLCGITVEEYGRINRPEESGYKFGIGAELTNAQDILAQNWYELLEPLPQSNTEIMATWTTRHLKGKAAITRHPVGKGKVWYVGTYIDNGVMDTVMPLICDDAALTKAHPCWQEGLEIVLRENENEKFWFLINQNCGEIEVTNPPLGIDLLTEKPVSEKMSLPENGVVVIHQSSGTQPAE